MNPARAALGAALAVGLMVSMGAPARGQCLAHEHDVLTEDELPAYDAFGLAVAMDGDVAVIGDVIDADNGVHAGAAFVFRFDGSAWIQEQKLLPDDGAPSDLFGGAVAVSGDTIVVGARNDDDLGNYSGSAYVFHFDGADWSQQQKLLPDDGDANDYFGISVAVSGDTAVVGAWFDEGDYGITAGSAYVFQRQGPNWSQQQKLVPDDPSVSAKFGRSVAIDGDVALVGAYFDDDLGGFSGSAYVFRARGPRWVFEQKLLAADGGSMDQFGMAVALSGDVAVVGALEHPHVAVQSGAAYVFRYNGAGWPQEQELLAPDAAEFDQFGRALDVDGDIAVVGAWFDDNSNGPEAGSAYVYHFDGSQWPHEAKLIAAESTEQYQFGESVAISGEMSLIGLSRPSTCAVCVIGGLADCNGSDALDLCDIAEGTSPDVNGNGVPDDCECLADLDGNGAVGITDFLLMLAAWGPNPGHPADLDGDDDVGITDFLRLLAAWGPCP
ncbi:MAG: FG-GAP repeat protein [Planctomycetota bacterium]|jgi:hypothetical protein